MNDLVIVLLIVLYIMIGCVVMDLLDSGSFIYIFTWPIIIIGFLLIMIFAFFATVAEVIRDKVGKPIVDQLEIWIKKSKKD